MMYSFEIDNLINLSKKFEEESVRVVDKLGEYNDKYYDIWFTTSLSDDNKMVVVDFSKSVSEGDRNTLDEGEFEFPIELLSASDNEIKEWATQPVQDLKLDEAITLIEEKVETEDDPYGSRFFEQIGGWLRELKKIKDKDLF